MTSGGGGPAAVRARSTCDVSRAPANRNRRYIAAEQLGAPGRLLSGEFLPRILQAVAWNRSTWVVGAETTLVCGNHLHFESPR